jgi:hypothetical protein
MHRLSRLLLDFAPLGVLAFAATGHAQVFFDRQDIMVNAGWIDGQAISEDITQRRTYEDPQWRARMLAQFPAADADSDGELTEAEAIRFHLGRVRRFSIQGEELEMLPVGVTHWTERVPMRDGETLPVEVFVPPGEGPWPTVLIRTARGRIDSALDYGNELLRHGFVVVGGDLTPEGDFINADLLGQLEKNQPITREERAAYNSRRGERNDGEDGADTIAWIAQQPWCNGRIGLNGYSEASEQSKRALAERPPELDAVITEMGSITTPYRMAIEAGGGFIDSTGRYPPPPMKWEAPTEAPPRLVGPFLEWEEGDVPDVFFNDRAGWFDFPVQGMIEEWKRLAPGGRATLIMGVGGHGSGFMRARMPPNYGDCDLLFPEIQMFSALLEDLEATGLPPGSHFFYFLMGDALDPAAPGNVWKVTDHWPVADREVSFYLEDSGKLTAAEVPTEAATMEFAYDPRDPVKTAGGNRFPTNYHGPRNQVHLDERDDVLFFATEPLPEALEYTGEAWVDLYVSSDAPDTAFVVQLLDIYPDGYQWPIRDGTTLARFHEGAGETGELLEPGNVYHLRIPLVATALMLAEGHRLGVQVMSSSFPAYPVHPNTWQSIESYDEARVARQVIHLGGAHASRVVLPVVSPGVSRDLDPVE